MNQTKAQGSLEILLVAAAVVALAFFFLALYLTTQESTTALLIAKNGVTQKLNEQETPAIIKTIRYTKTAPSQLNITIETIPSTIFGLDLSAIENEIQAVTTFSPVIISLNP